MANQKRTEAGRIARQQSEQVVDLFLDVLLSRDQDAGWEGCGLIGKLVDFRGDLPQSSGFSGFSKVYEQSKWLRSWTDAHKAACVVMESLNERQAAAVCYDRAYRGRTKVATDPFRPNDRVEIAWDDRACAQQMDCSIPAFRQLVLRGYRALEVQLSEAMAA